MDSKGSGLLLVLMALAVPGMAGAAGDLYNCTALARDGSLIIANA